MAVKTPDSLAGSCQRQAYSTGNQEFGHIQIDMEMFDIFARQEGNCVIHSTCSETIICTGRRYLDRIAESQGWRSFRLPIDADLRTTPIVSESLLCTARVRLP